MAALLLILLVGLCAGYTTAGQTPGLKARITDKALQYADEVAIAALVDNIKKVPIPDMHGSSSGVSYDLTGIKIVNFVSPTSKLRTVAGKGLTWTASGLGLSLNGNFKYKAFIIKGHGSFDVTVSQISLALSFAVGLDSTGHPTMAASNCDSNIGHIDLKFHGGSGWIINLISGFFKSSITKKLEDTICKQGVQAVNVDGQKALSKLPVSVVIDKDFLLDYRFISAPQFTDQYFETFHKGEIYWAANKTESTLSAAPFPAAANSTNMLYFWLSDYVANTFGMVAYQNGRLRYNLTAQDLPAPSRHYLNTTCSDFKCVGSIIAQIGKLYPNSLVEMHLSAHTAPSVEIMNGAVNATFDVYSKFYVRMPNGSLFYVLTLGVGMKTSLTAVVRNETLYGAVKDFSLSLNLVDSTIGDINKLILDVVAKFITQSVVIPELNKFGAKGFPLPVTGDIKFINPQIYMIPHALLISTDLSYQPKKDEKVTEIQYNDVKLEFDPHFKAVGNPQYKHQHL